jgi:hypothetical protein
MKDGQAAPAEDSMKRSSVFLMLLLAMAMAAMAAPAHAATKCEMKYTLSGWSAFYKVAHGSGTITCDNGQSAKVSLDAKGGGLTAGKYKIRDGIGKFSEVGNISEVFGTYAAGSADAGAVKSASAGAMTKGEVSLALSGTGTGFQLGISFGKFTITKK